MPIRKILLPLASTAAGEAALAMGLMIARRFDAHLMALHVRADSRDMAPLAGEGLSGAMIEEMMAASEKESAQRGSDIRTMFQRFMTEHGVTEAQPTSRGAGASYAAIVGREEEVVAHQARLADLTVVPHPEAGEDVSSSDALHAVLFDSGRPVLIAPQLMPGSIGTRICVAWNGSAESAAAVQTALPWLVQADAVRVLHAGDYQRSGPTADELLPYLQLYGITAEVAEFTSKDREVGAGLLAAARNWGADMLTMGAYSHSRLRQLFLGGVTRHVLENADLPVLMNR